VKADILNKNLLETRIYKLYKENIKLKELLQSYIHKFYQSNYNNGCMKNKHILMYNVHEIEFVFVQNSEIINEYNHGENINKEYLNTLIYRTKNTIKNLKNDIRKM
jgi:hypothetical protein